MVSDLVNSVMFHHFHDGNKFIRQQGSISANQLRGIIESVTERGYKILDPTEFVEKVNKSSLQKNEIALTFDDALKCQFDVAVPILHEYKLRAFFFIFSTALNEQKSMNFEVLRDFRHRSFSSVDEFYSVFFEQLETTDRNKAFKFVEENNYLADRTYLSLPDKVFRACRDIILTEGEFLSVHKKMMERSGYNMEFHLANLHMAKEDVQILVSKGHEIGLHSHTHPTNINSLSFPLQLDEYRENLIFLQETFGIRPNSLSYPCGLSNEQIRIALAELGIKVGFLATSTFSPVTNLTMPRTNHVELI